MFIILDPWKVFWCNNIVVFIKRKLKLMVNILN